MSAPKFPLPFCIEASDNSLQFPNGCFPSRSWPIFSMVPSFLLSSSRFVLRIWVRTPDGRTERKAKDDRPSARSRDLGGKERLKTGALSNYVPPFFPGYHDFNGDAHPGKIEVTESGWGGSWADRETEGKKRKNARLAGERSAGWPGFITFR